MPVSRASRPSSFRLAALRTFAGATAALLATTSVSGQIFQPRPCGPSCEFRLIETFDHEGGDEDILNYTGFADWTVISGPVNLYKAQNSVACHGLGCISLGGGAVLSSLPLDLGAREYTLRFAYRGDGNDPDAFAVDIGDFVHATFEDAEPSFNDLITTELSFSVLAPTTTNIVFRGLSTSEIGPVLDNIELFSVPLSRPEPVPEPAIVGLLGLGVSGLGALRRYRRERA